MSVGSAQHGTALWVSDTSIITLCNTRGSQEVWEGTVMESKPVPPEYAQLRRSSRLREASESKDSALASKVCV